jgi:hypothetical protein
MLSTWLNPPSESNFCASLDSLNQHSSICRVLLLSCLVFESFFDNGRSVVCQCGHHG